LFSCERESSLALIFGPLTAPRPRLSFHAATSYNHIVSITMLLGLAEGKGSGGVNQTVQRSAFVTVVAWIFIVLSGLGTLISILQNIMINTMFNSPEMGQAMQTSLPYAPPMVAYMASHVRLIFLAFLLVSTATLASAIGLLKRQNWARLVFIGLMVLGIVWNLGGLAIQMTMFSSVRDQFVQAPQAPDMGAFFIAAAIVSVLLAVGFSVLFGWIVKCLNSREIAAEFGK
jgi:hypothetical protein